MQNCVLHHRAVTGADVSTIQRRADMEHGPAFMDELVIYDELGPWAAADITGNKAALSTAIGGPLAYNHPPRRRPLPDAPGSARAASEDSRDMQDVRCGMEEGELSFQLRAAVAPTSGCALGGCRIWRQTGRILPDSDVIYQALDDALAQTTSRVW